MLKKIFSITAFISITIGAVNFVSAQTAGESKSEKGEIGKAYIECQYTYSYLTDTLNSGVRNEDRMLLSIGKDASKFYSYLTSVADSSMKADIAKKVSKDQVLANISKYKGGESEVIYKMRDNISTTNKIVRDYFKIDEQLPNFDWCIEEETPDNTVEIIGYKCHKATCYFRGRSYIAWFTHDIPVSNGPWKFGGLPGLIMKIADKENHYNWEIIGIKNVNELPVILDNRQYLNTSREKFAKIFKKFKEDPIGYMNTAGGMKVTVLGADGKPLSDSELKNAKVTVTTGDSVTSTSGRRNNYSPIERDVVK